MLALTLIRPDGHRAEFPSPSSCAEKDQRIRGLPFHKSTAAAVKYRLRGVVFLAVEIRG
nr:hypothetical protein [Kibdelosporangium sp. MJ126-NF4]CTQ95592.1 hypothetical protein [Kibdelosporangium sp. MJ126-NF4]